MKSFALSRISIVCMLAGLFGCQKSTSEAREAAATTAATSAADAGLRGFIDGPP
jgi:hypothetical protein